jgi:hypothetical protein
MAPAADGGEIWMLDSANYNTGPVAITKSVTILAVPGALGSVLATGGNAIDIATAGVKVALRVGIESKSRDVCALYGLGASANE